MVCHCPPRSKICGRVCSCATAGAWPAGGVGGSGGGVDVEDPFRCHHRSSVLSVQARVVLYRTSYHRFIHAWFNTLIASSRLLLVT